MQRNVRLPLRSVTGERRKQVTMQRQNTQQVRKCRLHKATDWRLLDSGQSASANSLPSRLFLLAGRHARCGFSCTAQRRLKERCRSPRKQEHWNHVRLSCSCLWRAPASCVPRQQLCVAALEA
ncbi:hypothetical protein TRVL_04883 [Trypanosoma vivax]|uniref:Uncharacterized protein n=1 Tax=Trypanosoma vivax (strain Y486) TaxID=1055687 RepID=G0TXZ8_TRYVY|nr:hypothetical protein TRVL_04883 [Trypanosoma vivax]CCC48843.1 hypothetical protein, unlikely [Trypanosoma vivax Y486]